MDTAVGPHCTKTVRKNKISGQIEFVYSKECSKKYIEKITGEIAIKGVHFAPENEDDESITDD